MVSQAFLRKRNELFKKLKEVGLLTEEVRQMVVDTYGSRGKKALEAIDKGGVMKRGMRWFVRGKYDEYEVVRTYCTCRDYVLNVVTGKVDVDMCYHVLAKVICEMLDTYQRGGKGAPSD
jgi:predicted nucleic acid-binding Zn finger protein